MMYLGNQAVGLNKMFCRSSSGIYIHPQIGGLAYIQHNLNSKKIFLIMQRINEDHSNIDTDAAYRCVMLFGATNELLQLDTEQTYTVNNGVEKHFSAESNTNTRTYPKGINTYISDGTTDILPNGPMDYPFRAITAEDANGESLNTVRIYPVYNLLNGRWVWTAYALD